jgi:hypothetical protein
MHIFIDETGSFGGVGSFPSPSLVGALIVPGTRLPSLEKKYGKLRKHLPLDAKGEVKGNLHHPFWVKSQWRNAGHPQVTSAPCPLCPQHQTFAAEL